MNAVEVFYAAETRILQMMVSALGRGAIGTAAWQVDRLLRMGAITEQSARITAQYIAQFRKELDQAIELSAVEAALDVDSRALAARKAGADVPALLAAMNDSTIRRTIESWQRSAQAQANLAMANLAMNAGTVYADIVSRAALSVVTGAVDGRSAMIAAIKEWSAHGIPSIVDRSGRRWTSEAYVNAVLRANTGRAAIESALSRSEEYGTDLVEVSSHPGSRPSHYYFQGHVYSRSGTSTKYPPLSDTGYGTGGGIGGANCGHYVYPFFEGVSTEHPPPQSEEENSALYVESQKQRALERAIRATKRDLAVAESVSDPATRAELLTAARGKLRDRQRELRMFIEDTGRTRRYGREQVYDERR